MCGAFKGNIVHSRFEIFFTGEVIIYYWSFVIDVGQIIVIRLSDGKV